LNSEETIVAAHPGGDLPSFLLEQALKFYKGLDPLMVGKKDMNHS